MDRLGLYSSSEHSARLDRGTVGHGGIELPSGDERGQVQRTELQVRRTGGGGPDELGYCLSVSLSHCSPPPRPGNGTDRAGEGEVSAFCTKFAFDGQGEACYSECGRARVEPRE
jgi:hypothetical protein